ncbi:unnamed protein product [Fraxinus pennsylvanica]|uniref:Uncharacterized protein n=1 Tax=Fraxinus pennsylvanica TaxID=56036 RepID=A0AAD1ZVY2_9LAMI|nr:unnamed protein product [Fraxinus pennsylvanica]
MESVLSLDYGRWLNSSEDPGSLAKEIMNENYQFENIRHLHHLLFLHKCSQSFFLSLHQGLLNQGQDHHFLRMGCPVSIHTKIFTLSCQPLNEEEFFEVQDKRSPFQLGWIHVMLPEAIAIVMAPTGTSR